MGLAAFAIVEIQCIERMKHHEDSKASVPTADEIAEWYRRQPVGVLLRAKDDVEIALLGYSEQSLIDAERAVREEVLESAVVEETRSLRRSWSQLGANSLEGVIGAVIFSAILVVGKLFPSAKTSPMALWEGIGEQQKREH